MAPDHVQRLLAIAGQMNFDPLVFEFLQRFFQQDAYVRFIIDNYNTVVQFEIPVIRLVSD